MARKKKEQAVVIEPSKEEVPAPVPFDIHVQLEQDRIALPAPSLEYHFDMFTILELQDKVNELAAQGWRVAFIYDKTSIMRSMPTPDDAGAKAPLGAYRIAFERPLRPSPI